jgi:hypothetical protein
MSASTAPAARRQGAALDVNTPAAPAHHVAPFSVIAAIAVQLALLLLIIQRFQIENIAFLQMAAIAFAGFVAHAFLPLGLRMPAFLALSIATIAMVLGPANAAWLVALGLALIGICHLPFSFRARGILLLLAAAALAVLRFGWLPAPWSIAIWPILASMFMFRMIVYFYDLSHDKAPVSWTRTLSYFFLLPNVCFPLFPVVDYKTFRRTYYDVDAARIYQRGVHWMLRGLVHLIVYRLLYYNFTLDPYDVSGARGLTQYLLTNLFLYLRVSGQFHFVIGLLHLYGFHLPETNHLYYLASSFTDYWRRINIYWKDFMLKVFYYPLSFSMKRMKPERTLVIATLAVFAITWALHLYQWFWLRGALFLSANDILFWGILAVLVAINALQETRGKKRKTAAAEEASPGAIAARAARITATFLAIAVLWALWTSASLSDWLALFAAVPARELPLLALFVGLTFATFAAIEWVRARLEARAAREAGAARIASSASSSVARTTPGPRAPLLRNAVAATLVAAALLALSARPFYERLGAAPAKIIASLRVSQLNHRDLEMMERGYYEKLFGVNSLNSQLWEVYTKRPAWPRLEETAACRRTNEFLELALVPNTTIDFHGAPLSINRWAMRDRDYAQPKPAGVYRIACLGASHLMGGGVSGDATFENLVEDRINREGGIAGGGRVEILNFGVDGYSAIERVAAFEERVLPFEPDAVFSFAHVVDEEVTVGRMFELVRGGIDLRYEPLRRIAAEAGVTRRSGEKMARSRLAEHGDAIMRWAYDELAAGCRAKGVVPVWVFLPRVVAAEKDDEKQRLTAMAADAGFEILDMGDAYARETNVESLHLAAWDQHPNVRGHELAAEGLYRAIRASGIIPLASTASAPDAPALTNEERPHSASKP